MARPRPEQQRSIASVVFISTTTIFKIVVSSADLKKRRRLVYSSARRVWEPFFSSKGGRLIKQTKQRFSTQRGNVCEVTFRKGLELFSLPLQLRKVRLEPGNTIRLLYDFFIIIYLLESQGHELPLLFIFSTSKLWIIQYGFKHGSDSVDEWNPTCHPEINLTSQFFFLFTWRCFYYAVNRKCI